MSKSINECMYTGPALQPNLWDIMVRARMASNLLIGDLQKAFLQIGLKTCDRDAFRFLFNINRREEHFRLSRLPFGAEAGPFVLGATLLYHYDQQPNSYEDTLESLKKNTYVDNLMNLLVISKSLTSLRLKQKKFWNGEGSQYTSGNQTSMY